MNIAIFSDNFYPEISGISDSVIRLGMALAEQGHLIMFVAPRYAKKDFDKAKLPFEERVYGKNISVMRLPSVVYPNSPTGQSRIAIPFGPFGRSFSKLKKFKPDIIHVQSPFGAGIEALMASKLLKVPLAGTNHTPIAEFMAYSPIHPKWLVELTVRYFSWYYNRCVFVSAPCNALLDDMSRHGFTKTGSAREAISNPVHLDAFSPAKNELEKTALKRRFGFSAHTVLYTGRLAEEKHVDVIIRAIALAKKDIPDIMFVITGHGTAEGSLKKLAQELGIAESVKFLGYVDYAEFPFIYQASDIFSVMSTAETQCLSLMQAFASGLPAVAARAWGLPEYIDEKDGAAQNGIVLPPGDFQSVARAFVELFNDPARMKKMGAHGIEAVKKYSPSVVAKTWEHIYSQLHEK
jgi:glycosyltransferase involved in cell wall biosynthesis